jgi:YidC/Oxa1 family membrane protein insertase
MMIVMVPLMIMAGLFTHITARHSVARQTEAQLANPQSAIMNKLTLYVFPIGVVVGAPFLPLAILFYWVSNNLWTLGQQRIVYNKIDREEAEKVVKKVETQKNLAPKVGQKPDPVARQKKPGAKPIAPSAAKADSDGAAPNGSPKVNGASGGSSGGSNGGTVANGSAADSSRAGSGGQRNGRPSAPTKRTRKR